MPAPLVAQNVSWSALIRGKAVCDDRHGDNDLLIKIDDSSEMLRAIAHSPDDQEWVAGEAGSCLAEAKFSLNRMIGSQESTYDLCLSREFDSALESARAIPQLSPVTV